mgnify:CR=1 FL=1
MILGHSIFQAESPGMLNRHPPVSLSMPLQFPRYLIVLPFYFPLCIKVCVLYVRSKSVQLDIRNCGDILLFPNSRN